jgi:hypothetical protein
MSPPFARLTSVVAVGAVVALAGCGGSDSAPDTPKSELVASVTQLGQADALTTTVRLDASPAALRALAGSGGKPVSRSTLASLASARLVVENTAGSGDGRSYSVRAITGGQTVIELRVVSGVLYVKGDVHGLLALLHKQGALKELKASPTPLPQFVTALVDGRWVSLQAGALSALGSLAGTDSSADPSQGPKLLAALRDVFQRDVTAKKVGSDPALDHLVLTGDLRTIAADVKASLAGAVPGGAVLTDKLSATDLPKRTIRLDAWVKDGALTQLTVDLAQFTDAGNVPSGTAVPLTFTFDRSGADIVAPPDATPVDLTQIGSLFGALTHGSTTG